MRWRNYFETVLPYKPGKLSIEQNMAMSDVLSVHDAPAMIPRSAPLFHLTTFLSL